MIRRISRTIGLLAVAGAVAFTGPGAALASHGADDPAPHHHARHHRHEDRHHHRHHHHRHHHRHGRDDGPNHG